MTAATLTRAGRRALALSALAGALLAGQLAFSDEQALAAYTAKVKSGTLTVTGDGASDTLVLRLQPGVPTTLQLDVGADGTADFSFDRSRFTAIVVEAGKGDDEVRVDHSSGAFPDEALTMSGGPGADVLRGGIGAETFVGGAGDDLVAGGDSDDRAQLGDGDDRFEWNPGDDSDTVDGGRGRDLLDFRGSSVGEAIDVSAAAGHVRFFRNVASITTDLDQVERIGFAAFGGGDSVVVNDLAGTDAETVEVNLAAFGGGGDGAVDVVTTRGTAGADTVTFGSAGDELLVNGLAVQTRVAGGETQDDVVAATLGGDDTVVSGPTVSGLATVNADGGEGTDTARYDGTAGADTIAVVANGTEAAVSVTGAARFDSLAENLLVRGLAGADTVSSVGNLAALTALTLDGGEDGDVLRGGNGADLLLGGSGADFADGNQGADRIQLGDGDDGFQWDPGDGNDVVEGGTGTDRADVFGSNIGEAIDISATGGHVRFFRNIASIELDLDDTETVGFHALGGADTVVVNDLTGTDATTVETDLAAFGGGADALADVVTVRGTAAADAISVGAAGSSIAVSGPGAETQVAAVEALDEVVVATLGGQDTVTTGVTIPGLGVVNVDGGDDADTVRYGGTSGADEIQVVANGAEVTAIAGSLARVDALAVEDLIVLGGGGSDTLTSVGNVAALTALTLDGGDDGDVIRGGNGADLLLGGSGDDFVDGNQGADRALLGTGDDRFQWDPGDGNDIVVGDSGSDRVDVFGSAIGEAIDISATGDHVRFFRNIANVELDLDESETVAYHGLGGADTVVVGDLTGTDTAAVDVDLALLGGAGDAQADTVIVNGTAGADTVAVTRTATEVLASGLAASTRITGSEASLDTLRVQALDGDDEVTVAPDVADLIATVVDLGAGD
jgi:Ca2+-binding RTX toxin-like protein